MTLLLLRLPLRLTSRKNASYCSKFIMISFGILSSTGSDKEGYIFFQILSQKWMQLLVDSRPGKYSGLAMPPRNNRACRSVGAGRIY